MVFLYSLEFGMAGKAKGMAGYQGHLGQRKNRLQDSTLAARKETWAD